MHVTDGINCTLGTVVLSYNLRYKRQKQQDYNIQDQPGLNLRKFFLPEKKLELGDVVWLPVNLLYNRNGLRMCSQQQSWLQVQYSAKETGGEDEEGYPKLMRWVLLTQFSKKEKYKHKSHYQNDIIWGDEYYQNKIYMYEIVKG